MAAQIFVTSIRQARLGPVLSGLPRETQDQLLSHAWSQLFLVHMISWPLPLPLPLPADCPPDLLQLLMSCRDLLLDPMEACMLETLILSRLG